MTFLNSILKNSKKYESPFNHWEYNNALSEEAIKEIEGADIPDVSKHNLNYDGTRAIDGGAAEFREGIASGGKAIKFRCFVTKHLNFIALPPDAIPSLNSAAPSSIALVPS